MLQSQLARSMGGALLSLILALALPPGARAHAVSGVVDTKGRVIIPCKYKNVRQLRNGFFLLEEFDPKNVWNMSFSCLLSDRDGNLIQPKLPTGFTLADVILPDTFVSTKLSVLPKETILKIHDDKGFALSNLAGHLILEPDEYLHVESLDEGMFEIWKSSQGYLFNALTHTKVPLSASFNARRFENGVIRFYGRNSRGNYMDKTAVTWIKPETLFSEERIVMRIT
jgi:hypothetical protein